MGYSIQYGPDKSYHKISKSMSKKKHGHWYAILAAVVIPCLVLVLLGYQTTADNPDQNLLPRQGQTAREAFNDFSDSVRSGEKFADALECLYRQILEHEDSE